MIYFISGHLDLTPEEFEQHYRPKIDAALAEGAEFVVGDARGADTMAQEYLAQRILKVTVYHMFKSPRNRMGDFATCGMHVSDEHRDCSMTESSDADIAWSRRPNSGTQRNIDRRRSNA